MPPGVWLQSRGDGFLPADLRRKALSKIPIVVPLCRTAVVMGDSRPRAAADKIPVFNPTVSR